jgi:hypothetical protein
MLINLGYLPKVFEDTGKKADDSDYGERTKEAVWNFQKVHGLHLDGIAGPDTQEALQATGVSGSSIEDKISYRPDSVSKDCGGGSDLSSITDKIVGIAGFEYDSNQDIYKSKIDSWQRAFGYYIGIDEVSAVPFGMVIDCEPIEFISNNKTYMIELWKGQYDLSTGSEIGIYEKTGEDPLGNPIWDSAGNDDMLQMSYTLNKNGTKVFSREGKHWWLTGFKPGEFSNPSDLTMDISITFGDKSDMFEEFSGALNGLGYDYNTGENNTVNFTFGTPKSEQPWSTNTVLNTVTQEKNYALVEAYNARKSDIGVKDNSPDSILRIFTGVD